jgi:uncharacterized phage protein (TIGR01671 family)
MRCIKFRAWDGKNKVMLNEVSSIHQYLLRTDRQGICGITVVKDTGHEQFFNVDYYKLEIMQFTGLLDKNGKEIYEGDIVKNYCIEESDGKNSVVSFNKIGWWVENSKSIGGGHYLFHPSDFEVIGNIYENPELLTNAKPMTIEQYKKIKLEEMKEIISRSEGVDGRVNADKVRDVIDWYLSQTIDELGKLPSKVIYITKSKITGKKGTEEDGWNACIDEAERMRDNNLSEKR